MSDTCEKDIALGDGWGGTRHLYVNCDLDDGHEGDCQAAVRLKWDARTEKVNAIVPSGATP